MSSSLPNSARQHSSTLGSVFTKQFVRELVCENKQPVQNSDELNQTAAKAAKLSTSFNSRTPLSAQTQGQLLTIRNDLHSSKGKNKLEADHIAEFEATKVDRLQELVATRLQDTVTYLQRKIQKQTTENDILTGQLSQEIQAKEAIADKLQEETARCLQVHETVSTLKKQNQQLKRKLQIAKTDQKQIDAIKGEYQLKINKMRAILRKKQDELAKALQKNATMQRSDEMVLRRADMEQMLSLREKYQNVRSERDDAQDQAKALKLRLNEQASLLAEFSRGEFQLTSHIQKLESELQAKVNELIDQKARSTALQEELVRVKDGVDKNSELMQYQVNLMQSAVNYTQSDRHFEAHQIKRLVNLHVKDPKSRSKLEEQLLELYQQVDNTWNKVLLKVVGMKQSLTPSTD